MFSGLTSNLNTSSSSSTSADISKREHVKSIISSLTQKKPAFNLEFYLEKFRASSDFADFENNRSTILMWLCSVAWPLQDIKKLLNRQDIDVSVSNKRGITALDFACQYSSSDVVKYLVTECELALSEKNKQILRERASAKSMMAQSFQTLRSELGLIDNQEKRKRERITPINIDSFDSDKKPKLATELSTEQLVEKIERSMYKNIFDADSLKKLRGNPENNQAIAQLLNIAVTISGNNHSELFLPQLQTLKNDPNFTHFFCPVDDNNPIGRDKDGKTLLMYAASYGMLETTQWLLSLTQHPENQYDDIEKKNVLDWLLDSSICVERPVVAYEILQLLLQRNCAWPNIQKHFYEQIKESNTKPELTNIANALKNAFVKELKIIAIWDDAKLSNDLTVVFYTYLTLRQIHEEQSQCKDNLMTNPIIDSFFQEIEEKAYYLFYRLISLFNMAYKKNCFSQLATEFVKQIAENFHNQMQNIKIPHSALSSQLKNHLITLKITEYTLANIFLGIFMKGDVSKIITSAHSIVMTKTYHLDRFLLGSYKEGGNLGMRYVTSTYSFGQELNARLQKCNQKKQKYLFATMELESELIFISKKKPEAHEYPWIRHLAEAVIMNNKIMKHESDSNEDSISTSSGSFFNQTKQKVTQGGNRPTITV